ncbi:MAG: putative zinc transporter msc2 [Caeruleum heppii]|nr:MAG: putative zinc transporter msc2 [Caeruleum heppii]
MTGTAIHHGHSHPRSPTHAVASDRFSTPLSPRLNGSPLRKETSNTTPDTNVSADLSPRSPYSPSHLHSQSYPHPDRTATRPRGGHSRHHHSHVQLPSPEFHFPVDTEEGMKEKLRLQTVGAPEYPQSNGLGYGFPPNGGRTRSGTIPGRAADSQSGGFLAPAEALTAGLLPLPFLLTSLFARSYSPTSPEVVPAEPAFSHLAKSQAKPISVPSMMGVQAGLIEACALTSGTLLLLGVIANTRLQGRSLDRRKESLGSSGDTQRKEESLTSVASLQRMAVRALGLGLPFYSALKLGGHRTAAIFLVTAAAGMYADATRRDFTRIEGWKRLLTSRKASAVVILAIMMCDAMGITTASTLASTILGYLAMSLSIFLLPLPFSSTKSQVSSAMAKLPPSMHATSAVPSTPWDQPSPIVEALPAPAPSTPLISTPDDVRLTIYTGGFLGLVAFIASLVSSTIFAEAFPLRMSLLLCSCAAGAGMLMFVQLSSLRASQKVGLAAGLLLCEAFSFLDVTWSVVSLLTQGLLYALSYAAVRFDLGVSAVTSHHHHEHHHHSHDHHHGPVVKGSHSRVTGFLLERVQQWPLIYSILAEKDSRRIFYFMILNFGFMMVQTFYGIATGSLGLLSDSIHMLFDCLALLVGLCAAVMSKWPPSMRFPYGLGKMDTLAGFANGIFLMLISIEIVTEAIERLYEGSEMKRIGELLTVSTLGLVVNLVGITAFGHAHHGHGHDHGHGGHDHGHSHGAHEHGHGHGHDHTHHGHTPESGQGHHHGPGECHSQSPAHKHDHTAEPSPMPASPLYPPPSAQSHHDHSHGHSHGHSHDHSHGHSHSNENMHGIFLHILADTLGSGAVVVSTILIHYTSWSGWDPLASCLIAILIFASAIPLVKSSATTLLLSVPADTEYLLRDTLAGVSGLRGVVGYVMPRFWMDDSGASGRAERVLGVMHVVAAKMADTEEVRERVESFLKGRGVDVVVQVEREGEGRCWCGGGVNKNGS